ncbi:hypothetical protein ACGF0J_21860 [Nonomuraea sp. NPDC047897]|uniref:hypothetical protein n=1 Tax=Nonomuraea sp. NPDC047897 TaxID=3364346 RepID=UPI0037229DEB
MPEHPLAIAYVLGAYASLVVIAVPLVQRPWVLDMLARDAGMSRRAFTVLIAVAYTVLWPITWAVAIAQLINDRRNGRG